MACLLTTGQDINCEALRVVGGVNKRTWFYNFDEFVSANFDANNFIDILNFTTSYVGLHTFTGRKSAHSGGYTAQIQTPGGNKFYQHDVIIKLFPDTPNEDAVSEILLVGCFGIILETNNDEFILYGLDNGMDLTEGVQNTGQEQASDIAETLTFTGNEKLKPKRIFVDGSSLGTKNYLDSLVV